MTGGILKKWKHYFQIPGPENARLTEKPGILKKIARGTTGTIIFPPLGKQLLFSPRAKKKLGFPLTKPSFFLGFPRR